MKKSRITAIIICIFLLSFAFGACAGNKEEKREYLINGYEDYYGLAWTSIHGDLFGEISVNTDSKFITQGTGSAKFDIDFNDENGSIDHNGKILDTAIIRYATVNYDDEIRMLDKIDSFAIDIYNATPEEFFVYFSAEGEQSSYYFSQGSVLAPNGWNRLKFDVKPWFFEKDTEVKYYTLYIKGFEKLQDKKALFYMDNFRAYMGGNNTVPEFEDNNGMSAGGIEILNFDSGNDVSFILTDNATDSSELLPLVCAQYDAGFTPAGENGALRINFDRSHKEGHIYEEGNGYDIRIHASRLKQIEGAKTIRLNVFNPDSTAKSISLIAENDVAQVISKKTFFGAQSGILELDVSSLGNIGALTIRIDSWNVISDSVIWLSNLKYTI